MSLAPLGDLPLHFLSPGEGIPHGGFLRVFHQYVGGENGDVKPSEDFMSSD